jgi:hypothetical protein
LQFIASPPLPPPPPIDDHLPLNMYNVEHSRQNMTGSYRNRDNQDSDWIPANYVEKGDHLFITDN